MIDRHPFYQKRQSAVPAPCRSRPRLLTAQLFRTVPACGNRLSRRLRLSGSRLCNFGRFDRCHAEVSRAGRGLYRRRRPAQRRRRRRRRYVRGMRNWRRRWPAAMQQHAGSPPLPAPPRRVTGAFPAARRRGGGGPTARTASPARHRDKRVMVGWQQHPRPTIGCYLNVIMIVVSQCAIKVRLVRCGLQGG